MKFKSEAFTAVSGSIGGVTYSHNRGGMYRRARAVPVNVQSPQQTIVRSALTTLVDRWTETLTPAQRASWDLYADNVTVTNPLGDQIKISGQNWFIAANTPRIQAVNAFWNGLDPSNNLPLAVSDFPVIDAAPTIFDRGEVGAVEIATSSVGDTIDLTFDTNQAWVTEDGAAALVYVSRPRNPSQKFFAGPWRLIGAVIGDSLSPPNSPASFDTQSEESYVYATTGGQAATLQVVVTRADGRLSSPVRTNSFTLGAS